MSLYKTMLPYCSGFENFRCMGFLTSGLSSRNCNKIRNGLIHGPQSLNCHHKPAGCGGLASTERDSATPQNLLITSGSSANGFMCSGPELCKNFMMYVASITKYLHVWTFPNDLLPAILLHPVEHCKTGNGWMSVSDPLPCLQGIEKQCWAHIHHP